MRVGLSYFNNTVVFIFTFGISAFALSDTTGLAADFTAGTDQELRNAIAAANASSDTSSTITLTGNFTMGTTALPVPTKSITIDTQGFTLSGPPGVNSSGAPQFRNLNGSNITLLGNYVGGTGTAGANSTGGYGLFALGTGTSPLIVNNGTLTGGVGYIAGGRGGAGARVQSGIFINNGTAQGGSGRGALQGGVGVEISTASLTNSGRIQGGSGPTGGAGVQAIGGTTNSLVNTGTIRGGTGVSGSVLASGVLWGTGFATLDNQGTIEGGTGGAGIWSGTSITATNSGTIRAGSGQANAIMVGSGATAFLNLTLKAGSVIEGNVVGSSAGTNDVLRFGGAADAGFDVSALGPTAQYRNFDMLEKADTGTWTLSGNSDFAGPTSVLAGKLVVNGALAGSAVMVAAGATLAGSGTVGATTITAGGTIAPGNSIGTITVNGAFVQQAGSTYQVEVDPGTMTSDLIKVNGTATLANGATVSVVNYTGAAYAAGQRYTILTSTGLTGTYGFAEQVLTPFLSLRDSYDPRNVYLTVVQTRSVGEVGTTRNEVEVGQSVDSLPAGDPIQNGMLNQPSIDAAQRALNQLSGEIHASAKTALIEESWLLRAAINDRLRAAFGSVGSATLNYGYSADLAPGARGPMPLPQTNRFAVWGQGYGSWGRADSDGNAATLKRSTGGFLLGADAAVFDKLRFGVVAGYSRSDFDVNSRLSSGESDNYHLGLYGGGQWGALNLRAGASYTWHDVETRRALTSAYIGGTPHASYNAATAQAFGEVGYRIELGRVALEPFAGLAYVDLHSDGFSETGATAALTSQGGDTRVGYSTLGLRSSTQFDLQGMAMTLRGGLAWRHAFGDVDPKATLAFAGSSAFTITGLPIARDAAMAEAGLDLAIGRNATLGVSYTGQLAEDAQDHSFKGVLAVRF